MTGIKIRHFFLIILLITGCTNPFDVRNPESPDNQSLTAVFDAPTTPRIVLTNFARALEQKNVQKYLENFSNSDMQNITPFHFEPEQNLFDYFIPVWTIEDEGNYFINLLQTGKVNYPVIKFNYADSVSLTAINASAIDDSVESNYFRYTLEINFGDSVSVYQGRAKFKLLRSRTTLDYWYIYFWSDFALDENYDKSWSFLKSYYRWSSN